MAKKKRKDTSENSPVEIYDSGLKFAIDVPVEVDSEPIIVSKKIIEVPLVAVKPLVSLKVFCHVAGPKWDQMAGFNRYAASNKLGPFSILDWRIEFQKFMRKPTK